MEDKTVKLTSGQYSLVRQALFTQSAHATRMIRCLEVVQNDEHDEACLALVKVYERELADLKTMLDCEFSY